MGKKKKFKKKLQEMMMSNLYQMNQMGSQNNMDMGSKNMWGTKKDFLRSLGEGLNNQTNQQFVIGLLLGAAGAFVLSDEKLRGPLMKWAVKMYSDVLGGFEEFKEQMADLKAEADYKSSEKE